MKNTNMARYWLSIVCLLQLVGCATSYGVVSPSEAKKYKNVNEAFNEELRYLFGSEIYNHKFVTRNGEETVQKLTKHHDVAKEYCELNGGKFDQLMTPYNANLRQDFGLIENLHPLLDLNQIIEFMGSFKCSAPKHGDEWFVLINPLTKADSVNPIIEITILVEVAFDSESFNEAKAVVVDKSIAFEQELKQERLNREERLKKEIEAEREKQERLERAVAIKASLMAQQGNIGKQVCRNGSLTWSNGYHSMDGGRGEFHGNLEGYSLDGYRLQIRLASFWSQQSVEFVPTGSSLYLDGVMFQPNAIIWDKVDGWYFCKF